MYESTLNMVFAEMKKSDYEKLTVEEENELLKKAKIDKKAKDKLFKSVFRFIFRLAKLKNRKSARRSPELFEDFLSEGAEGILEAIEKFDTEKLKKRGGTRFLTFASLIALQKMQKLEDKQGKLSASDNTLQKRRPLLAEIKNGTDEEIEEIAKKYNVRKSTVRRLQRGLFTCQSLDTLKKESFFAQGDDFCDSVIKKCVFEKTWSVAEKVCTAIEKDVLIRRFGLFGTTPQSVQDIAKDIGRAESTVVAIFKRAKDRIKNEVSEK